MYDLLRSLLGRKPAVQQATQPRSRLAASQWPAVIYAIGDVHGCMDELRLLEEMIAKDAESIEGERWLVSLGDHIDRGPQSSMVISHLMSAPEGFRRIVLLGNHEQMLLDFLADPVANSQWLEFGGIETARSYGVYKPIIPGPRGARSLANTLAHLIPQSHLEFLRGLPVSLSLPGVQFVHAGIRPGVPIEEQTEEDLLWIRAPFLERGVESDTVVVHGHTPANEPEVRPWRIGVDTGAFASGKLTAVRLREVEQPAFISTRAS